MRIRPVDLSTDLPNVLEGIQDFISRMDYHDFLPDSEQELIAALQRLLNLGCVDVLVAEHKGKIVGGIGLLYAPCTWNSAITNMDELFWWVSSDAPAATGLRLIRYARQMAQQKGCHFMTFKSLTSSPKTLDKVYRRMGLRPIEVTYMGPC